MSDDPQKLVEDALPKSWSAVRKANLAGEIVDVLSDAGLLVEEEFDTVEVATARMPVESVEAYGLRLRIDALGEAVEIHHPDGLVTL